MSSSEILTRNKLHVLSRYHPDDISWSANDDGGEGRPVMDDVEIRNDGWDNFNHPRYRRLIILKELSKRSNDDNNNGDDGSINITFERVVVVRDDESGHDDDKNNNDDDTNNINHIKNKLLDAYLKVHSNGLVDFLSTAWNEWDRLGEKGQDPNSTLDHRRKHTSAPINNNNNKNNESTTNDDHHGTSSNVDTTTPTTTYRTTSALIPGNMPLPREAFQRPSNNVMGKMGYYCTDDCTPIFDGLLEELVCDLRVIERAVEMAVIQTYDNDDDGDDGGYNNNNSPVLPPPPQPVVIYALCTHPGHHAAYDSFGGYCYFNNAALTARLLQGRIQQSSYHHHHQEDYDNNNDNTTTTKKLPSTPTLLLPKVAILDVDYHCGNGTASIFYNDPSVLVVSIHCHPDCDYPFHSGYDDEIGTGHGVGTTLNIPLLPQTIWDGQYDVAIQCAMERIMDYNPDAIVVSLGLDTHKGDPCAIRRAGFELEGNDYTYMGETIGRAIHNMVKDVVVTNPSSRNDNVNNNVNSTTTIPIIVVQEGGYKMDKVPSVTANFLMGIVNSL